MSWTPADSAIRVDADLEKALATANFEEIKKLMRDRALQQGLVVPDIYDPNVLLPTGLADNAPKQVGKVVVVNGVKHSLVAENDLELAKAESDLFRRLFQQPATAEGTQQTEQTQPRGSDGRFTSAEHAASRADLELRFKRGDISAQEYLEQSGAMDQYLSNRGLDIQALRETVEEKYTQSWASATDEFISRHPEWQGGQENMQNMGQLMVELAVADKPSVDSLEAAYAELRRRNLVAENPELRAARDQHDRILAATNHQEIRDAIGYQGTTALWGR